MIDKNKAYRFSGDSERWVWSGDREIFEADPAYPWTLSIYTTAHLHERGILLEYPELPGEDWEYCEREQQEKWLHEASNSWSESKDDLHCPSGIYCRKKKPVITEVECVATHAWSGSAAGNVIVVTSHNDLLKGIQEGDRVKVTKL